MISNAELITQRLEEYGANKLKNVYKKPGATYKAPGTFKSFNDREIKVKLLEVLSVSPTHVFNSIKERNVFPRSRKIQKETDKLKSNKHCAYHNSIEHNTSER